MNDAGQQVFRGVVALELRDGTPPRHAALGAEAAGELTALLGRDLAALVPSAAPGRNPTLAFEVSTAAITTSGRPGNPSNRSPLEPFGPPGPSLRGYLPVQPTVMPGAVVNPVPFAAPGTPQWFAPPQQPCRRKTWSSFPTPPRP